ncbi:MAG: DUF2225 domain-containing protein [candidate division Zixibacteria bacterium]|nr:DUF2225 domain-containing protein [candidate division Zixibacteria bacterium]
MNSAKPLFFSKVTCPICGSENKYENISKGAFKSDSIDTDFMPLNIKWDSKNMEGINPLLYFVASCPKCYYSTEMNHKLKEWKKDIHFKNYKQKHLCEEHNRWLHEPGSPIQKIVGVLDAEKYPYETAILKLILSIFDESLNLHPSTLTLGRYYLRIGWIFRDMSIPNSSSRQNSRNLLLAEINEDYENINDILVSLNNSTKNIAEFFRKNYKMIFPDMENGSPDDTTTNYFNLLNDLLSSTDIAKDKLGQLGEMNGILSTMETETKTLSGNKYQDYPDFGTFLLSLKDILPETPVNENEALNSARTYYQKCAETGRELKSGYQSLQAFYLIGELARRVGLYDESRKYLNFVINEGRKYSNDRNNNTTEIEKVNSIVERAYNQNRLVMDDSKTAATTVK